MEVRSVKVKEQVNESSIITCTLINGEENRLWEEARLVVYPLCLFFLFLLFLLVLSFIFVVLLLFLLLYFFLTLLLPFFLPPKDNFVISSNLTLLHLKISRQSS